MHCSHDHYSVPITTLALSSTQAQIISGTATGQIHVHALPSHQHLRTINTHAGSAITHLSIISRPPDLVGHLSLGNYAEMGAKEEGWPVIEVKPFERMRVGKKERDEQEIGILLGPKNQFDMLDEFDVADEDNLEEHAWTRTGGSTVSSGMQSTGKGEEQQGKIDDLQAEVLKLEAQLKRAKEINDEMWKGVVKRSFDVDSADPQGDDVEME
jgi:pre-rRNA-processing protein IPI3